MPGDAQGIIGHICLMSLLLIRGFHFYKKRQYMTDKRCSIESAVIASGKGEVQDSGSPSLELVARRSGTRSRCARGSLIRDLKDLHYLRCCVK